GRREDPFISQSACQRLTGSVRRLPVPSVWTQRRERREWLRRPRTLAGNRACRNRTLLDWKNRRARLPVEHEHHSGLCRLNHRRLTFDVSEQRRRRVVVVPQIVVHRLEVPYDSPGRSAQCHNRARVVIPTETMTTIVVGTRRTRRNEDQI